MQINIKYPGVKILPAGKFNKAENKINGFYDSIVKNFIKYCEKILYKTAAYQKNADGFKPFGAVMTFETTYNNQDFLCVYLDINIYAGKGRGNIIRKAQIWNLTSGELYSPKRIINFNKPMKMKVCEHICKTMEHQIKYGKERYINADTPSVYKQNVYNHLNIYNMFITENGYAFFFPQNTIAPNDSGIVDFVVPEKILKENENGKFMRGS